MNPNPMNIIMNQFGGPQQFQHTVNGMLQQYNVTYDQYMQNPQQFFQQQVQAGNITQEELNRAMQQATQAMQSMGLK